MSLGLNDDVSHMMNECEKFGSISGCHRNCPIFTREECEIQDENELIFLREEEK